jgi:hypothetical protein
VTTGGRSSARPYRSMRKIGRPMHSSLTPAEREALQAQALAGPHPSWASTGSTAARACQGSVATPGDPVRGLVEPLDDHPELPGRLGVGQPLDLGNELHIHGIQFCSTGSKTGAFLPRLKPVGFLPKIL